MKVLNININQVPGSGVGEADSVAIRRNSPVAVSLTVATGQTASGEMDARGLSMLALVVPAEFDGTTVKFQGSSASGGTFQDIYDASGSLVEMTVAASRSYDLPAELAPWGFWKIVCGTSQTGATVFVVVGKG